MWRQERTHLASGVRRIKMVLLLQQTQAEQVVTRKVKDFTESLNLTRKDSLRQRALL